jgi:RimJ/RimL family protein N-acetyltransferase
MMAIAKFLEGEKVYLRPVEEGDAALVYFGKNNSAVRETLFLFAPMTLDQVRQELTSWSTSKEIMLFTICSRESDEAVGQTAFVRIDYVSRAAVFYIAIYDPQYWAKGFGGEATRLMVHYAFDILNLNRIQLHVCCDNEHGVQAYRRAGFQIEGTLRQAMYHHDRYIDFYVMAILRSEYYDQPVSG